MLDMLLANGIIITVDANHTIYERGYVGIEGDRIACLGPMNDNLPPAIKTIDLNGHPVLPGLIDGHGHAGHCLTKVLSEHNGDVWEEAVESVYYRYSDEDFWYTEGALAAAERIKFGVTTGVSMVGNTPRIDRIEPTGASLEGAASVGIRQLTGIGAANGPWPKIARSYNADGSFKEYSVTPDMAYATTEATLKAFNGRHPRQTCIVAPGRMGMRQWESVEDNIAHNRDMLHLAQKYNVPLHTHAYGNDVQFLHDHTPEVLRATISLTHSTGYSESELNILAASNAYVFHGPTTHAHIMRRCPVVEMLDKGIKVAIITDGAAPDRSYDLWRDMKNTQLLQRAYLHDSKVLPCGKVLEMVTIEPARALGLDHLVGSIEPGKKADLITINIDQPHLAPFSGMPVQRLVLYAMGQDVERVIVDGVVVMEDRRLTQIDETALLAHTQQVFDRMIQRLGRSDLTQNPCLYDLRQ
ncbi:MAG: amidohydrolase family protein [Clostridia bacterium]